MRKEVSTCRPWKIRKGRLVWEAGWGPPRRPVPHPSETPAPGTAQAAFTPDTLELSEPTVLVGPLISLVGECGSCFSGLHSTISGNSRFPPILIFPLWNPQVPPGDFQDVWREVMPLPDHQSRHVIQASQIRASLSSFNPQP